MWHLATTGTRIYATDEEERIVERVVCQLGTLAPWSLARLVSAIHRYFPEERHWSVLSRYVVLGADMLGHRTAREVRDYMRKSIVSLRANQDEDAPG